jgi:hypothetical protein
MESAAVQFRVQSAPQSRNRGDFELHPEWQTVLASASGQAYFVAEKTKLVDCGNLIFDYKFALELTVLTTKLKIKATT